MNDGVRGLPPQFAQMPSGLLGSPKPIPMPDQYWHPEAIDWATRAAANGGAISTTTIRAVSEFCRAIDTAGIRDRFARVGIFAGGNLSGALVPLYRSFSYGGTLIGNATDTNVNFVSGDYAETGASGGLQGNGTTKYLNCGASIFSQLSVASIHMGISGSSLNSGPGADATPICANSAGFSAIAALSMKASGVAVNRIYANGTTAAFASAGTAISSGHIIGSAISATDLRVYQNGTQNGSTVTTTRSGSLTANAPFIFAHNNNGTAISFSSARLNGYSIGLGLTAAQAAAFSAAVAAFNSSLGR